MRFMNVYDIGYNARRFVGHPVKYRACRIIWDLMNLANEVSDGWCYWPKPARSASKLAELIEDMPNPTVADLKKALVPIKAMLTRNAKAFGDRTLDLSLKELVHESV